MAGLSGVHLAWTSHDSRTRLAVASYWGSEGLGAAMIPFDPGSVSQPFRGLCESFPDGTIYPPADFRVEWGPIFYRGRLDGTARVVVIGQDPAQHEVILRRVLVGAAGHRVQGLLAKLGIDRSYAIINAFLYSAYNQQRAAPHINDPAIASYRNQWLDALLSGGQVEGVMAFGNLADAAWQRWKATPTGAATNVAYRKLIHPTAPRSAADLAGMLQNWNQGLQALHPAVQQPDTVRPLVPYGSSFQPNELVAIPAFDVPAGCPAWMRSGTGWATRKGLTPRKKRATIVTTVPSSHLP